MSHIRFFCSLDTDNVSALCICLPCTYAAVTRGALRSLGDAWSVDKAAWVSALVALGAAVVTAVGILPLIKWRMAKQDKELEAAENAKT